MTIDFATSLYDKNFYLNNINKIAKNIIADYSDYNIESTILFCDINGLKYLNDTQGHAKGDQIIRGIANIIKESIRQNREISDSIILPEKEHKNDNIPIRIGGDEFLIILPRCDKVNAKIIIERIKNNIKKNSVSLEGVSLAIGSACISETKIPDDVTDKNLITKFVNQIINLSEKRMYLDKRKTLADLSLKDRKLMIAKKIGRLADELGINLKNENEFDDLINEIVEIKNDLFSSNQKKK